ncbi:MAG: hypothetical protein EZS28_003190 [Streblomastix strix]|uniref:Uncharacterized protein n=1 Tax=Streblomastix strix TaxID=222440 RepID=A0A5J4X2M2_9EUKA|nr:MAG: hypothetical protein EZS28_003190 [Streblomastix strix]
MGRCTFNTPWFELLTWYQATQIIICTLESAFVVLVKAWNVVCASRKLGRSIENEEQEDTSIYTQAVNVLTECGAIVSLQSLITEQQDNNEELEEGDQLSSAAKRLLNLCEQLEF